MRKTALAAGEIPTPQQRILEALAGLAGVGLMSPNRATVAAMSGYRQGGNFNNMLGGLRTRAGLVRQPPH